MTGDLRLKRMRALSAVDGVYGCNEGITNKLDCLKEVISYAKEQIQRLHSDKERLEKEAQEERIRVQ